MKRYSEIKSSYSACYTETKYVYELVYVIYLQLGPDGGGIGAWCMLRRGHLSLRDKKGGT